MFQKSTPYKLHRNSNLRGGFGATVGRLGCCIHIRVSGLNVALLQAQLPAHVRSGRQQVTVVITGFCRPGLGWSFQLQGLAWLSQLWQVFGELTEDLSALALFQIIS